MILGDKVSISNRLEESSLVTDDHVWVIEGFSRGKSSALKSPIVTDIVGSYALDGIELHVSLSHSADVLVLIVSLDAGVGVDVERLKVRKHADRIARRYFGQGEPQRTLLDFYRSWTAREAFVKAIGSGLARVISNIVIEERNEAMAIGLGGLWSHRVEFLEIRDFVIAFCRQGNSQKGVQVFRR